MSAAIEFMPALNGIPYFGSAKVVEHDQTKGLVSVTAHLMGSEHIVKARMALPQVSALSADDEVLIAGSTLTELFIIGVVSSSATVGRSLKTKTGAYATLSNTPVSCAEVIQVYSPRNELLFEYDPVKEQAKVNVSKGNLTLCAEEGDICLNAARSVQINGNSIDMTSRRLNAKVGYGRLVFDRLETITDTLVEQAKNVYRTVAQLTQLRTGRMRILVDETYQFKANKAFLKAEDDFKIKGEKIHLG